MVSRRRRKPCSRSTGEGDIKPKSSPAYTVRKAALTDEQARLSLELAEEAIAVDPDHRDRRIEIDDVIYDRSEPGIMVAYSVVDGEVVFLTFRDLFDS